MGGVAAVFGGPGSERFTRLLDAYMDAPDDADIELRLGSLPDDSDQYVLVSVNGNWHAFSTDEARAAADVLENTFRKYPTYPETRGFPDLILALRETAKRAGGA